jgi:DNA polymerase III subunit epsilon
MRTYSMEVNMAMNSASELLHAGQMDFVAIDVETANSHAGSICSVGLAFVEGGQVVGTTGLLTRPPSPFDYFESFNVHLHGIKPDDVVDAPPFSELMGAVIEAIGDRPVVAHNASFDIRAIREACDAADLAWPTLTYGCSLVFSRRMLSMLSYRLPYVCDELGIDFANHHDAASDALASAQIVLELGKRSQVATLDGLAAACGVSLGRLSNDYWFGCKRESNGEGNWGKPVISAASAEADPDHPLFGQSIVFTGALMMPRQDAYDAAASLGAVVKSGISKKVSMLVIGDGFSGDDPSSFHTGKAAKAAELMASGHAIEIIDEREFMEMLTETATSGSKRQ